MKFKGKIINIINRLGKFVYAGISHISHIVNEIKLSPTLSHKMFDNIRAGDWLLQYTLSRINESESFKDVNRYLNDIMKNYVTVPTYKKPMIFCAVITSLINLVKKSVLKIVNPELVSIIVYYVV